MGSPPVAGECTQMHASLRHLWLIGVPLRPSRDANRTRYNHPPMDSYVITRPTVAALPVVATLPHSGTYIPPDIASGMLDAHLSSLPSTDWHLDRLYTFLPDMGVTTLRATHSRYVIDLITH